MITAIPACSSSSSKTREHRPTAGAVLAGVQKKIKTREAASQRMVLRPVNDEVAGAFASAGGAGGGWWYVRRDKSQAAGNLFRHKSPH